MPENNYTLSSLISVIFIVALIAIMYLVFNGDLKQDDIHNILNTYILIAIAIISVAFAAMAIKPPHENEEKHKEKYEHLFGIAAFTGIVFFMDVMTYFYSFLKTSGSFQITFCLGAVTWFTFISIVGMIYMIYEFQPEGYIKT